MEIAEAPGAELMTVFDAEMAELGSTDVPPSAELMTTFETTMAELGTTELPPLATGELKLTDGAAAPADDMRGSTDEVGVVT